MKFLSVSGAAAMAALSVAYCGGSEMPRAVESKPPAPAAPAPPPVLQEVTIDSIVAGNPAVVTGRARTFENRVAVRVVDSRGEEVARTTVTSDGEMGRHNPYRAELWLTRDPGERLVVEAFESSAKDGSPRSLVRTSIAYPHANVARILFLPDLSRSGGSCTQLYPVERWIPATPSPARVLAEALIAGPTASEKALGYSSPMPAGAAVRSIALRSGVLTVDLNERMQNVGGACAAQSSRASLTETLRALPNVRSVVITAAGSRELALQP